MKKLILVILVVISGKSFGQQTNKSFFGGIKDRLSFGLKAGANYSNFTDAGFTSDPLVGFHAGATVAFRISDHWSAQEDFLYSIEGAKSTSNLFGAQDIKISYLSVPVLFRYKMDFGLFAEIGTQASIKLSEKVSGLTEGHFANKTNIGAVGGIGFQTKSGLGISGRYVYGLTKVGDFSNSNLSNDFKSYTAQMSLFYSF